MSGEHSIIKKTRSSALVVNSNYPDVSEDWFSPEYWGELAQTVTTGGRGGAWFLANGQKGMVLRQYRRGGMVAHVSERSYLFTGFENSRAIVEFHLLQALKYKCLPVPTPIAAYARKRHGIYYRAAILVERIQGAQPFPESSSLAEEDLWCRVGRTLRQFHDEGLDHVDLNCDNILIAEGRVYLIDFDRCRLRSDKRPDAQWKKRNLDRLRRSVEKRCQALSTDARERLWQRLLQSYWEIVA